MLIIGKSGLNFPHRYGDTCVIITYGLKISGGYLVHKENIVSSCFMLPVMPLKAGKARDLFDDISEKYSADIEGQLKLFGVQKIMAFLQTMRDEREYLVMYMRSRESLDKTFRGLFGENLKCSKYLADRLKDITGLDLSKPENAPKLELLMDWGETREFLEERQMLKMPWGFTAPIKQGRTADMMKYFNQAMPKRSEWEKLLREHDVVRNMVFLQHTQQGDFIVKFMVASNTLEDLMKAYLTCNHEMCNSARKFAKEITGIDFSDPKNMPEVKLLLKWDEQGGFETADQLIAYTE